MAPMPDPADTWPLPDGLDVRDELLTAYADPARGYHDLRHLTEVTERIGTLAESLDEPALRAVLLAAWFHDAVYDGERDAEERSAAWAERALDGLVDAATVAEVARLVRLTESHRPAQDDLSGCVLSDADLGILAADAERYAEYVAAVRREYAHLDDAVFTAGRRAVLADLLAKPRLFHTPHAVAHWEEPARANAGAELARLAAS